MPPRTGMAFCSPFDDPAVVAGQGTLGLELLEDIDDLATVIVPLGGGGLISGVAIAVKSARPDVRVIGVQAAVCAPYAGGVVAEGPVLTLADGIAVKYPGRITKPLVERWVDEIVTVDEDSIADAMVLLMDRAKLYVEGAGAVGVAALLSGVVTPAETGTTCVVISGGNVDLGVVPSLIRRHENQAGRRLSIVGSHRRPTRRARHVALGVRRRRRQPDRGRTHPRGHRPARPRDGHPRHVRGTWRRACTPTPRFGSGCRLRDRREWDVNRLTGSST